MYETIPVRKGEELPLPVIERYLREQIDGIPEGTLEIRQFGAGHSNLTYEMKIGEWEAVLRRPPLGPVAPKAHDMKRESIILKGLNPVFPIAPRPYLYCEDTHIIGSEFFVMERKRGIVLDQEFPPELPETTERCRIISEQMVDTLVKLHEVDYANMPLMQMSQPDGFFTRQVHGWIGRYERAKTDEVAGIEELTSYLLNNIPVSPTPTVIHYDYKLNNSMFSYDGNQMVGLFDWEMTTIGDPLCDLGAAMGYWIQADDPDSIKNGLGKPPVTVKNGFYTRNEFLERYARKSGRDISNIHFYFTFAIFKLAGIIQQIYYRYQKGQTNDVRFARFDEYVKQLVEFALTTKGSRWV